MCRVSREMGPHRGKTNPLQRLALKTREAEFLEFIKPVGLGTWSFGGQLTQHWASWRASDSQDTTLKEKVAFAERERKSSSLHNTGANRKQICSR